MDTGPDTHGGEHEPNQEGLAAEPTAPEPSGTDESWGEDIAIPAGDITGALTEAIESATGGDDEPRPEPEAEVDGDPQAPST
jgi:hypothetical protein